jgi:hypothetical protein
LLGENNGPILGEEVLDMEQILRDQHRELNKEKAQYNELMRQIQNTKNRR